MTKAPKTQALTIQAPVTQVLASQAPTTQALATQAQPALLIEMYLALIQYTAMFGTQAQGENAETKVLLNNDWQKSTPKTLLLPEPVIRMQFILAISKRSIVVEMTHLTSSIQSI